MTSGTSAKAVYRYRADGEKLGVTGNDGHGYDYRGSFLYARNGSSLTLSGAYFGEGFISTGSNGSMPYYHLKDHLGSIRVVLDSAGVVRERNDYYPFGTPHLRGTEYPLLSSNLLKYNGKEEQTISGSGYLDYGARMYDAKLGRWISTDPLSEKYYGMSPYTYCGNNPIRYIDPDGRDWIVAEGTTNYQWRDDINVKSTMPKGYQYVGATDKDILTHLRMNYNFHELNTNDVGMVTVDAELGKYAVSHFVNVREKSNATITVNVSLNEDNMTDNNSLGRTFNGISINVMDVSFNSGVDGEMMGGGLVNVQYGDKIYQSILHEPEGTYFRQTGTTISVATVNIPQPDLSVGTKFSQIQVKGNWFVRKPEGRIPVVRHALVPYPLSFKHTWTFK